MKKKLLIKSFVLSLILLFGIGVINAQVSLPFYEGFDYQVSDTLGVQATNWTNLNSGDKITVTSGSLPYSGLANPTGNSVSFDGSGMDPYLGFTPVTSGTVFASFIFKVTDQSAMTDLTDGGYFAAIADGTTSYDARIWERPNPDAASNTFDIGFGNMSSTPPTTSGTFNVGDDIFVVMSYDVDNGEVDLWVNPSSSDFGGTAPTATITGTDASPATSISKFILRQDSPGETPFIQFDELRIGTTWSDVTPAATTSSVATDLFFSEYIEGSSYNKALEIFNGTGAAVDLSNYVIRGNHNGSAWEEVFSFPVGTMLANGDVYVLAHELANASILAEADSIVLDPYGTGTSNVVNFNGDDVRALCKVAGTDTTIIDIIGLYDLVDPGSGWDVAGVTTATANHTLVRKSSVTQGDTVWATSAGTDADNSEWVVYGVDYIADLGSHAFGTVVDTTAPTFTAVPDSGDTEVSINALIVLTFNEAIRNIDDSEITDANVASLLTLKETDASGTSVAFTATIDAAKKVITATPDAALKINQVYYGAIVPVEDTAGNATAMAAMTFTTISKYSVTFNVDMSLVNGFDPSTDSVFVAGSPFGNWAGPGTNPDFKMTDPDGNMVYSLTVGLDIPVGDIAYKFFLNAGWDGGEWVGDPNRTATITGDTTINAVFGNTGQPIVLAVPFTQNFDYVTASAPILLAGWTNANVATGGVINWIGKEYASNKYAQVTSFGSSSTGADQVWMITPGINMDSSADEQLSFDVNVGYWKQDGLSVKISTDFDGTIDGIVTATWTDVTSGFTIPSEPASGYGTFATAGTLDVSSYTDTMYVAFVYNGNLSADETTTYQIDSVRVQSTTGINNIDLSNQLSLYPNPGNGIINIALNGILKGKVNVKIMDITGRIVFEKSYTQVSAGINVNISKEVPNLYFITLSDANHTLVKKFMKR